MIVRHIADDIRDQDLSLVNKLFESYGFVRHANETAVVVEGHILATRRQNLVDGARVTFQIDDEGAALGIIDAFVFMKVSGYRKSRADVVERGNNLPGIEVGEGENRHLKGVRA